MKKILGWAAAGEVATGLALLLVPQVVGRILLGGEMVGSGNVAGRIAGSGLIGLGIACWPNGNLRNGFYAMFTYSTLAMVCLIYAWYIGLRGMLLWPGVCYHAALSIMLVWAWRKEQKS